MSRNKDNAISTNYAREITKWQYNTHARKIIVFFFLPQSYHLRTKFVSRSKWGSGEVNRQQTTVNRLLFLTKSLFLVITPAASEK